MIKSPKYKAGDILKYKANDKFANYFVLILKADVECYKVFFFYRKMIFDYYGDMKNVFDKDYEKIK